MDENKQFVIDVMRSARGDDLYRAKAAFRNCTPEEMHQEYGQSGKTRAQIVAEREERDRKWQQAMNWLESK